MPASPYSAVRQRREQRHMRLVGLGYTNYTQYLRSPYWQAVRVRFRASDQPQDCMCGKAEDLQLHHMTYERVGAEELSDLTLLCNECHQMIHALEQRGEIGLDFSGFISDQRAARYADGYRPPDWNQEREVERDGLLKEERRAFLAGLAKRQDLAMKLGVDIRSDLRVVARRVEVIDRKLGI